MIKLAILLTAGGDGVAADPSRAEALLQKAISSGNPSWGATALGDFYVANTPLKDRAKAAASYEQAVSLGNTDAMLKLADLLTRGDGIPADPPRAEVLIKQAIAQGADPGWGAIALGDFYSASTPLADPAKAAAAYEDAAKTDLAFAKLKLATILTQGIGEPADPPRAEALIKKAIEDGAVGSGAEALGDFYLAKTPLRDPTKAVASLRAVGKCRQRGLDAQA